MRTLLPHLPTVPSPAKRGVHPHRVLACHGAQVRRDVHVAAAPSQDLQLQKQWASMHTFFESSHFGSVQHRFGKQLQRSLAERYGLRGLNWEAGPELAPLDAQVDPHKRVDPIDLMYRWARDSSSTGIPRDALLSLLASVHQLLAGDPGPLLDIKLPVAGEDPKLVIVGDTHGQLLDVLHIFHTQGPPSESCMYLFNGDIADRGPQAVEILILVLAFKLRFPSHVHFLRGNHENREINERPQDLGGGFLEECLDKYGCQVYELFQRIFCCLPLFAVVESKVFVVHGGLFRTPGVTLDRLRRLSCWQQHYPMAPMSSWTEEETILLDAQWADPHPMEGFRPIAVANWPSKRGPGVLDFGKDITARFLEANGLSLCVRSHECPRSGRGFAYAHNRRLLTVFSASNYGGVVGNRGSVALLRPSASKVQGAAASAAPLDLGGVNVQVKVHDIRVESPESGSAIFRQASLARQVSRDSSLLQPALGIVLFNREAIRASCRAVDAEDTGCVAKGFLLEQLAELSVSLDWDFVLNDCLEFGPVVSYRHFLDAIHVKWMYSSAEHAAKLVRMILRGRLPMQDLKSLLGFKVQEGNVEQCMVTEFRQAVKLLSPDITHWQLDVLEPVLCSGGPRDFVQRLLLFAPPARTPPEPWMRSALAGLGRPLRAWAGSPDACCAAFEFFSSFGGTGTLSVSAMALALGGVLRAARPEDLEGLAELFKAPGVTDDARLEALVTAMDGSHSGSISFVELAQALGLGLEVQHPPEVLRLASALSPPGAGFAEFIFSHRGALLRGCRFLDTSGSGLLEPSNFFQVALELADIVGQPLDAGQVERLRAVLGTRLVPYALALSRFETGLDAEMAAQK